MVGLLSDLACRARVSASCAPTPSSRAAWLSLPPRQERAAASARASSTPVASRFTIATASVNDSTEGRSSSVTDAPSSGLHAARSRSKKSSYS